MLDLAIKYPDQVIANFRNTWFKDKYKYFHNANYFEDCAIKDSTWTNHQFVSVRNGEVIGYIGYGIDRSWDLVNNLAIINFEDSPSMVFAADMGHAIRDIFEKYQFRKLCFSVVVGNPIESSYDKMCLKYGGRIVGIRKKNARLIDGNFYDEKLYEIFKEDYINAKSRIHTRGRKLSGEIAY